MSTPESRLAALGLVLPPPPRPVASYVTALRHGDTLYLSGHGPIRADGSWVIGRVGADLDVAAGREAARLTALSMVATLRAHLGTLDRVVRFLKVLAFVRCTPEFGDSPEVVNGFSDTMVSVFGEAALAPRSAVGTSALPRGTAVEVEAVVQVRD